MGHQGEGEEETEEGASEDPQGELFPLDGHALQTVHGQPCKRGVGYMGTGYMGAGYMGAWYMGAGWAIYSGWTCSTNRPISLYPA